MADGHDKVCRTCVQTKPVADFPLGNRGKKPGPDCRPCFNARRRASYAPSIQRGYSLKKRYGITSEQFDSMLADQGGCAICGRPDPNGKYWHVDHDHACCDTKASSCGKCMRAILCHGCNTALGNVSDNPEILRKMIEYLEAHRG